MNRRSFVFSISCSALIAAPALAGDNEAKFAVHDPYMRTSTPTSKSGAAFMQLMNKSGQDDRLIGAKSPLDGRIELHTHKQDANGVMKMTEIEGGIEIPAGATHDFVRGGDHLMFMGMSGALEQGRDVPVTLIFEKAGEVEIVIPVDRERKANHSGHSN